MLDTSRNCPARKFSLQGPRFLRREVFWQAPAAESVIDWLCSWQVPEKFYFSDKNGQYEIAGLGSALTLSGISRKKAAEALSGLWSRHPEAVVFGGAAFAENQLPAGEWKDFGCFRFTLPVVELRRIGSAMRLAFNYPLYCASDDQIAQSSIPPLNQRLSHDAASSALRQILAAMDRARVPYAPAAPAAVHTLNLFPPYKGWDAMIVKALENIRAGVIDKVVLSRKMVLTAREDWNIDPVLMRLAQIRDDSFVFLYQTGRGSAFFGRTPERLLKLEGRSISVDALAGTRPRGRNQTEDSLFETELLQSPKEIEEHRIVSRYVETRMHQIARNQKTLCRESILKLKNLQHIFTQHCGELRNGHHVLDTLACFHPTPAVNGHPAETARNLILQWEPYDRGWYAGPIGWMTGEAAEFAVGIRSALVHGNQLHIFAGAGIVPGSTPLSEWQETEDKMQTMVRAAGAGLEIRDFKVQPSPKSSTGRMRAE